MLDDVDREDIPEVHGKEISDKEVDIGAAICFAAGILGLDDKVWPRRRQGQNGFDLDAPESLVKAKDHVVAVAVGPGLGNGET